MKYFVAYKQQKEILIREFDTRDEMIDFVLILNTMKDSYLICVWTEGGAK